MTDRVSAVQVMLGEEERDAVERVLRSGRLAQGSEVAAFEDEFAALVSGRECVAVNSGTSALHLGLLAAGIGAGDEVVVPSFTFAASANAVAMAGATPVFADIDPATFCLDPESARAAVTERTRAILPVHLYGQPAGIEELRAVAESAGVLLIEDACQAPGSSCPAGPAGTIGDLAAFSFYATKNMTTGEGGMVVCKDGDTARRVRLLRNQGMQEKYHNEIPGLNNRMTELAAAIGRVQLVRLADLNRRRQEVAATYDSELAGVTIPAVAPGTTHVYHQYTIRTPERDRVRRELDDAGIDSTVFYPVPTHRLPAYGHTVALPATDLATAEVLSLPVHPGLSESDVARVIEAVNDSVGHVHG